MTAQRQAAGRPDGLRSLRPALVVGLLLAAGAAAFAGASAHLVYFAVTSQPECVDHLKPGAAGVLGFSAAKSSC
mgnify:CR=1 FL=1